MAPDKLVPNDPRVQHRTAFVNGQTYGYLCSTPPPSVPHRGHIVLVHGFPDLSFGWRYQIPFLTTLGLTVIAPDSLGYGRSSSPPTSEVHRYGFRQVASDIAALCHDHFQVSEIYLGGHDWGGTAVYRIAMYQPALIKAVFVICTPFNPPLPFYTPLKLRVRHQLPNFGYQLHFTSGEVEDRLRSKSEVSQFLNALYGGSGSGGEHGFDVNTGVKFENLPKLRRTPLLEEAELEYYATEYSRHGLNGPLNWYRTGEVNYLDELDVFFDGDTSVDSKKRPTVTQPVLFVLATKDQALKPAMAAKMASQIPNLVRKEVEAGHWVLWQRPEEINKILGEWFEGIWAGEKGQKKLGGAKL